MAALGVDLVSSLAGVTGKVITGATGELVLWQGLPVATSITGGVAALGMTCTVIYWTMTSLQEKCEKCGYTRRA
jgi:uncharacterized membrane protein (DUF441 family)